VQFNFEVDSLWYSLIISSCVCEKDGPGSYLIFKTNGDRKDVQKEGRKGAIWETLLGVFRKGSYIHSDRGTESFIPLSAL